MASKQYISQVRQLLLYDDYLLSDIPPSSWAEEKRVMTTDVSNFPGQFSYDRTPYLREVVDCLRPDHPSREIAVMKGAQIGFSTGVIENGIGWLISEHPCSILLAARDEDLVKDMMDKKIDQMITSCGLRDQMRASTQRARNQRTGDTSKGKEFAGGSLRAFSIQKPGRMRQISVQVGFLDDFEAAPVDKTAGGAASLFRTRFKSYGDSKKIFWISTPEVKHLSNIEPLFLRGDQRKYHVPCPACGEYIVLEWRVIGANGKKAGIVWEIENDELIEDSVGYVCQSCGEFFSEGHKYDMNLAGEWKPTARQKDPSFFSYHISALYAPPGMDDWVHYVREYLDCCPPGGSIKLNEYKVFINTCLGYTWEVKGTSVKVNRLAQNTRSYPAGTVPNQLSVDEGNGQIVMLTVGVDLNGTEDDARLDYEIVAWSESGASYSVDHGSCGTFIPRENTMKVKVDRERWSYVPYSQRNVWDKFTEIVTKTFPSDSTEENLDYGISVVGIDTGNHTQYAYDYVEQLRQTGVFTVGVKGQNVNNYRKMDANTRCYTKSRERADLYVVQVNQIKDELAGKINLRWVESDGTVQPNGFMNFPAPQAHKYTMKDYFSHYDAEHKVLKNDPEGKEVGYMWQKKHANVINTFWDCRVYNEAVKEIVMDTVCKELGVKDPNWRTYCKAIIGE